MNIAIIDDLNTDRKTITKYLHTYFSKHYSGISLSIHTFESGEAFLRVFRQDSFDFIFIDYYMDGMSGLDTARAVRAVDSGVVLIFTTASRDYAVDSYKVKASGYLVKPIIFGDFSEILSLIDLHQIRSRRFIEIINGYDKVKILLKDIIFCDISGHYVQIHTESFGLQRTRMTFSELVRLLKVYREFLVCYRGCLINMNQVHHIDDFTFFMNGGERIPLRKKEQHEILDAYSRFLFEKAREQYL